MQTICGSTLRCFYTQCRASFGSFEWRSSFYELGYWAHRSPKARYLLWASAIEAIYTSHGSEHKGSVVAKERIKWFLGENTSIYPDGELSDLITDPQISVASVVEPMYEVRNYIAHGDRIPDPFLTDTLRGGFNGPLDTFKVLFEAQSFIIRKSLLKILRDNLLVHFSDAAPAEAYFSGHGLTRTTLQARIRRARP